MRPLLTLLRGLGLFALVVGLLAPLTAAAQGETDSAELLIFATACPDSAYSGRNLDQSQCEPGLGVSFSVTTESGDPVGSCTANELGDDGTTARCFVSVPYESTLLIAQDVATLPSGVESDSDNPTDIYSSVPGAGGALAIGFFNRLIGVAPTTQPEEPTPVATTAPAAQPTEPATEAATEAATETLTAETDGSTAAIYAGDCDTDFTDERVATLTNVRAPDGDVEGADGASTVETSFTTLDLPLEDVLAEHHVLVVFDEDDDTVPLVCGPIGGIVAEDGSLVFGLPVVRDSLFSGVAYLTEDGDQTLATIFLAENLSGDETPEA